MPALQLKECVSTDLTGICLLLHSWSPLDRHARLGNRMGMGLSVGFLADLKESDEEGYAFFSLAFRDLDEILRTHGLDGHVEPDVLEEEEFFSCDMLGYSGIHYLRRIAANLALGRPIPGPGSPETFRGTLPELEEYAERFESGENLQYQHLIMHSDAEGFYVPIDFERVIATPTLDLSGGWVGSTTRLRAECLELASLLDMPVTMELDARELQTAIRHQLHPGRLWPGRLWRGWPWSRKVVPPWMKYAVETYSCLGLLSGCEASLQTRAALVFG